MDQGFAPTNAVKAVRNAHLPQQSPVVGARGALRTPKPVTGEDKAIAAAQGVRSVANFPFLLMLPGMLMGMILAPVSKLLKRERTQVVMGGGGQALLDGMRQTTTKDFLHTPATMVDMVANKAAEVGGRAQGWEAPLRARSDALGKGADKLGATLSKAFAPIRSVVGNGLEKINLKEPVKTMLGRAGRLPVGATVAAVAATAGVTAIWLTRKKTSREHAETVTEMRSVFGEGSPIAAEAAKVYSKEQSRSIIASALESANEALFVGFEAMTGAGGKVFMGMMAGQMGLSSAQQLFHTENVTADAYTGLKKAQSGEIQVSQAQKAFWFQVMIGSMPVVQAKGGSRNHLAAGMGQELAEKGTTIEQFAALVSDHDKFTALAASVSEKMDAAKAAKKAKVSHPAAANEGHIGAVKHAEAHPTMNAAAPAAKVSAVAHDGHIHAQQLASSRQ